MIDKKNWNLLIMIPCYNERDNVEKLCSKLTLLPERPDILFVDDNSPDGTGDILESISQKNSSVKVIHRTGKLGIGSAHKEGISWAYRNNYDVMVTMDCDFTHSPKDISLFLEKGKTYNIVVGSRYMQENSLEGWNFLRKILTLLGHKATGFFLGMPYDATGAFRFYNLRKINPKIFELVRSNGYSFFFESLYILSLNRYSITEIPIKLSPRTYGSSKMKMKDAFQSLRFLVTICKDNLIHKKKFMIPKLDSYDKEKCKNDWEIYWEEQKESAGGSLYDFIASFYRVFIIRRILNFFLRKYFKSGAKVLHAGCGGGQVDADMKEFVKIVGLDISPRALAINEKVNQGKCRLIQGDIFDLPFADRTFDGIYNLGVMEHFTGSDIERILKEFHRALKDDGKIVIFWPPEFGLSVIFLKGVKFFIEKILRKKNVQIHPDEITRVQSKKHVVDIFDNANFKVLEYYFGPRDVFTYAVIVAEKKL